MTLSDPRGEGRSSARLRVVCPDCGGAGMVRWDRLQGLLYCRGCATYYRINGSGQVVIAPPPPAATKIRVAVRSYLTGWLEHEAPVPPGTTPGRPQPAIPKRRGFHWKGLPRVPGHQLALGGLLLTLMVIGLALWGRSSPPRPRPLPHELESRVRLWAEAWLAEDVGTMLRLTEATHDRALRRWLASTPPPSHADKWTAIEVAIQSRDGRTSNVVVRIGGLDEGGPGVGRVLHQRWVEKQGDWFQVPMVGKQPQPKGRPTAPVPSPGPAGQRKKFRS